MGPSVRIFINEKGYLLPVGSTVRDGIATADPSLLPACDRGEVVVTDGSGLPLGLGDALEAGAIVRARVRQGRGGDPVGESDA